MGQLVGYRIKQLTWVTW